MFKFRSNVVLRFNLLVIFGFTLMGIVILGLTAKIMFIDRDYWNEKKEENFKRNVTIEPNRGNILADNGDAIVSSLPKYRMLFDFEYKDPYDKKEEKIINAKRDSIWKKHLHELCEGLNEILPGTSVAELEQRFRDGMWPKSGKPKGGYQPYKGTISYLQYKEILELPIIKLGKKYSGFYTKDEVERKNILGNTGNGTFGVARRVEDGKGNYIYDVNGLERIYDSYLKGEPGVGTKAKMRGNWILREDKQAKDGCDVQTTLNTQMLDICHTALERELRAKTLPAGWVILMETKTGDIKAIVNLSRNKKKDGTVQYVDTSDKLEYNQTANHALCDLNQPGSIFKTVALTAMLADGKLTTKDSVKAYSSMECSFNGHRVHDEMYRDNGTGKYSMYDAMMYSSNISMVQFIRKAYLTNPEEYTNTLTRFGMLQNYNLIENEATPYFPRRGIVVPGKPKWDGYSLHTLSYGYAISTTAINMVSFYNTIANGGKQMKPRLVKAILNNGKVVKEFPATVMDEQLFPKAVADTITGMLVKVVNGKSIVLPSDTWRYGTLDGTGKQAHSEMMTIAGKTGTANYRRVVNGTIEEKDKLMSFCGFFPAEEPEYTLIVQIMYDYDLDPRPKEVKDKRLNKYGGGSTSAIVFKEIAEKIMADRFAIPFEKAPHKEGAPVMPVVKRGNINDARYLVASVGLLDSMPQTAKEQEWGEIKYDKKGVESKKVNKFEPGIVPDVKGMGAKDATYLLQEYKLNVNVVGYGKVAEQSIPAGREVVEGDTIRLLLQE